MKEGFKITMHKGFHMTFKNGYTISVQFGAGNYCDNYNEKFGFERLTDTVQSSNAEIAVWGEDGKLLKITKYDTVIGHLTPNEVADWINKVMKANDSNDIIF